MYLMYVYYNSKFLLKIDFYTYRVFFLLTYLDKINTYKCT